MKEDGLNHFNNSVPADHPLLLLLADIAAEKDVPIDIHFDIFPATRPTPEALAAGNPPVLNENQAAFERLLDHNPKARFNWAHIGSDPAGQRTPDLMRDLLTRHPNLFSAFRIFRNGPHPSIPFDEQGILKPEWRKLIEDFPDRFTVHTDIFYISTWPPRRGGKNTHEQAKRLLEQLPPDIARKLAYENAQRIYKLKD
jgi:predicted TIM-barrel fold metal-dependent hydrolase